MISRERLRQADKHARRRLLLWWNPVTGEQFTEWQRMRKITKRCSCDMCGNPRKHFGQRTRQEMQRVGDIIDESPLAMILYRGRSVWAKS